MGHESFDTARPGLLHEIAGVTVSDIAFDHNLRLTLENSTIPGLDGAEGCMLADELHTSGADVIATHQSGWRNGQPAITSNAFGKGRVVSAGVCLDPKAISADGSAHTKPVAEIVRFWTAADGQPAPLNPSAKAVMGKEMNFTAACARGGEEGRRKCFQLMNPLPNLARLSTGSGPSNEAVVDRKLS